MKVLLDECVPERLRAMIAGHDVYTVRYMGWSGTANGRLLAAAAAAGFDAVVTTDRGIENQQDVNSMPLSVILLRAPSNSMADLRTLVPGLLKSMQSMSPRSLVVVG